MLEPMPGVSCAGPAPWCGDNRCSCLCRAPIRSFSDRWAAAAAAGPGSPSQRRAPRRAARPDRAGRRRRRVATPRSPGPWVSPMTPSASGGAGSASTASTVLRDRPRTGRPPPLPRDGGGRGEGAGLRAARRQRTCRWPSGAARTWPPRPLERGIVASVSASTVRRWLAADALKPWQHRSWIFPRDPDFAVKAARVLDLYARVFDGEPLGDNDYVLSADEKPGVQARSRIHPSAPPRPGRRPMRVESEYRRHGTLAYLAAYDVHRAQVIGHCAPTTGIAPFTALVEKVMTSEPYASARRVFWIVDNGSSHRGWTAAARLHRRVPERAHDPPAGARVLAQPGRDLLLRRPTQTAHPRRLRRPRRPRRPDHRVREALQHTPHDHSTGASTATTSTDSSTGSPHDPRRTNGRDH